MYLSPQYYIPLLNLYHYSTSKIYVTNQYFDLKSNQLYLACFLLKNHLSFIP